MNRRGAGEEKSLFSAFEIILFVIVFLTLIFVTTNFDYISRANEVYLEKDIPLMATAVQSAPGDIEYEYPVKEIYYIEDKENRINVIRDPQKFGDFYSDYNITITKDRIA
ncbi:MAG: hypothetical protein ABIJ18_05165 [archaeon]